MAKELDTTCNAHSGIVSDIAALRRSDKDQWDAIKALQNRLPTWATLVISLLTFGLGASITYAGFAVKMAEMAR